MRIIKIRSIDRNWGVRYTANIIGEYTDKIDNIYKKVNSAPIQQLTYEEMFRLREYLREMKIMSEMLAKDVAELDAEEVDRKSSLINRLKFVFKG